MQNKLVLHRVTLAALHPNLLIAVKVNMTEILGNWHYQRYVMFIHTIHLRLQFLEQFK